MTEKLFLRRDHDDTNIFHIIAERPPVTKYSRAVRWNIGPLHEDMVAILFGARVGELADSLSRGDEMPIEVTARCLDDNEESEAA